MLKHINRKIATMTGYYVSRTRSLKSSQPSFEEVVGAYCLRRESFSLKFLQIGAFDGISFDPIHAWVRKFEWKGVLCEPNPEAFSKLSRTYESSADLQLLNVAVMDDDETRMLYYVPSGITGVPSWLAGCSTFDEKVMMRHSNEIPDLENM